MFELVHRHKARQRNRGQLQSDEEHQEVACAHHEVHTQQRAEDKHIEFTLLVAGVVTAQPVFRLQEDQQRADSKDGFDNAGHGIRLIHAAKKLDFIARADVQKGVNAQQDARQSMEATALFAFGKQIVEQNDKYQDNEADFRSHIKKLKIIHRVTF